MPDEIRYICAMEREFPEKLRNIPKAPEGIYVRGSLPDPDKPSVAIIGARKNTEYGRGAAVHFAKVLSSYGVQIISGMARGIDGISQDTALKNKGRSFGVLGCGIDVVYPKENRGIYENIVKSGGLISEYPPGTPPKAELFPQRNRLISALSDVLLVIEARIRSGTSITVRFALEQGRDVFAVPGRITDPLSHGCNALIADGAGIATCPEDILEVLGLIKSGDKNKGGSPIGVFKGLDRTEETIMKNLDFLPLSIEELSLKTSLSLKELMTGLLTLEIKGCAEKVGAGSYIKRAF